MLSAPILVDAHVHLHTCFDRRRFLDHAAANFARAADRLALDVRPAVLVLTEAAGERSFEELRARPRSAGLGDWSLHATAEGLSLVARHRDEDRLLLVAGRQLATRESLEVLALGCDEQLAERQTLDETIAAVKAGDGVPVIPWGFGKWWLGRGRLLESLLEREDPRDVFLADSGCRPGFGRRPPLLDRAERLGFAVLAGSDPLPLPDHVARPGSCGFVLETALEERAPGGAMKRALRKVSKSPGMFAFRRSLGPFVRDQVAMQIRLRGPGGAG